MEFFFARLGKLAECFFLSKLAILFFFFLFAGSVSNLTFCVYL